jgi:phenylpropionate dioxygenase-like ring-hydroxylating dioxygenase large terminal subunit|tara:strand:+ start:2012 stop:2341 length:330 start_codon:yes stop_codon:yes gene_type:complete
MKVEIGNRVIGETFPEERIFRKKVRISAHLYRVWDAWGIDAKFFTDVLLPMNYQIEVFEVEEGKIYEVDAEKFKKHGVYFHFKEEDEDHRAQIFLSRRFWKVSEVKDNV